MYQESAKLKPLYLSEEEALSLLELFVLSPTEATFAQEQVLLKLSNLTRRFLRSEQDETEMKCREPFVLPATRAVVFA